ncbi:beta strand repeat-containing protein, partial [Aurantiacibacter zhengii]
DIRTGQVQAVGGNAELTSAGGAITTSDVSSTADVLLDAATRLTAQNVSARNDIVANSIDNMVLTSATADSDDNGTGDLTLTSTNGPLKVTGASSGVAVDIDSGGTATLGVDGNTLSFTQSTGGVLDIDAAGDIRTGQVQAVGGNAELTSAGGSITTANVSSTRNTLIAADTFITSQNIDADLDVSLVAGTTIQAEDVTAGNHITATSEGRMVLGSATANDDGGSVGDLSLGSTDGPLRVTGASSGVNVDIDSGGAAALGDVTATDGNLAITAGNSANATVNGAITTQDLSATNGNIAIESVGGGNIATGTIDARNVGGDDTRANIAIDTAGSVMTGAINAGVTDAALLGSLTVGGGTTPDTVTFGGEVVADAIDVVSNTAISTGDLTALATDVSLDAGTRISTQNVIAEGDAMLDAGTSIEFATVMAGDNASLDAGTFIDGGSVTAGIDAILDAGTTIATGAVSAADDVAVTSADRMTLASVTADSDGSGVGSVSLSSTDGPLTVSGATSGVTVNVASGGNATLGFDGGVLSLTRSTGGLLEIDAAGTIRTGQIQATGGNAELTSSTASITTDSVSATGDAVLDAETSISSQNISAGRDVLKTAGTSVSTQNISAVRDVSQVAGSSITSLDITAGRDVSLTAGTTIGAQAVTSGNAITTNSVDATTLASATADSDSSGAGSVDLTSTNGPLTVTGAARGVSVEIDSGGAVTLGSARSTGGNVTIDAIGNLVTGPITSSANLLIGQMDAPANVQFGGTSNVVGDVTITSDGTITVAANSSVTAGSDLLTTSADIDLGSGSLLKAEGDATLTVSQDASQVRLGAAASNGGGAFALTDAELNRIEAQNLLLQANSTNVEVSSVTFDGAAGSETFTVATTGDIAFTGAIDGSGTGGLFQFGGSAPNTGLAGTISMNTERASLLFAGADLQVRADDILFGTQPFIQEMIDLRDGSGGNFSGLLGALIVGNSGSSLYNAGLDYSGPATYLEASNLNVVYGDSALFQNSGEVSTALVETTGVNISQTLTIDPTDTTNAFAIFGTIETLEGRAAALADPSIVILLDDDEVQPFASRINGCQIRSGADCLNTVIGNTIVEISSEQFDLFSSESDVLLPFDPLVGTNNEGLFSDVGPDCEEFDENGICITPSEEQ